MAKKINKSKETFTVKDFKMWLSGLTEFQEAGWTPNERQWKTIIEKIELLDDSAQYINNVAMPSQAVAQTLPQSAEQSIAPVNPHPIRYINEDDKPVAGGQPSRRFQDTEDDWEPPSRQLGDGSGIISLDVNRTIG